LPISVVGVVGSAASTPLHPGVAANIVISGLHTRLFTDLIVSKLAMSLLVADVDIAGFGGTDSV